jgi:Amt family ammonium transporter
MQLVRCSKGAGMQFDSGDTAWMLTATLLVMMMLLPGLALFYGGLVRAKNLLSVMSQVMGIARSRS